MTAKEIQNLDYVKEGVRYTIHVEGTDGDEMWGTWNCHSCGVGGTTLQIIWCEGTHFAFASF
jgi:hypothetical protein